MKKKDQWRRAAMANDSSQRFYFYLISYNAINYLLFSFLRAIVRAYYKGLEVHDPQRMCIKAASHCYSQNFQGFYQQTTKAETVLKTSMCVCVCARVSMSLSSFNLFFLTHVE